MLRKKLKKQTNIKGYFHARATHICECVFVWADYERFPNSSDSTKSCLVIQFTATSTQPWPLTPSPLTWKLCPFGAAISWLYKGGSGTEGDWGWKWRGRIINYQHNDHNCVQVLPSVLERSTSKDLRAPQPAAHRTFTTEGKPRTLTGLEAEAQNVYKQLAMLTNNKGRNCQGHSLVFQLVKNGAKLDEALLWEVCMTILVYQIKSEQIQKTQHVGYMSRSQYSSNISWIVPHPLPSTLWSSAFTLHRAGLTASEAMRQDQLRDRGSCPDMTVWAGLGFKLIWNLMSVMLQSPAQSRLQQGPDGQTREGESGKPPVIYFPLPTAPKIWAAFKSKVQHGR